MRRATAGFGRATWACAGLCLALAGQSCGSGNGDDEAKPSGGSAGVASTGSTGSSGGLGASGGTPSTGGDPSAGAGGHPIGTAGTGAAAGETNAAGAGGTALGGSGGEGTSGAANPNSGGVIVSGGSAGAGASVGTCTGTSFAAMPVAPALEFLVDTSGSMSEKAFGASVSKWEVTRDALHNAFDELSEGTGVGLIFFPNTSSPRPASGAPCILREEAVPMGSLDAKLRNQLDTALAAALPLGATPTHDALRYALETLASSPVAGDRYLVLVTDGAPNYALECLGDGMTPADTAPLLQEVVDARNARGIQTFVIGSPGSESARVTLSQMATLGGTAQPGCSDQGPNYCHFDMTVSPDFGAALSSALGQVAGATRSCTFALPTATNGAATDLGKVNITLTSNAGTTTIVKGSSAAACQQGWQYDSSGRRVVLCPDTCASIRANPSIEVRVVLGCPTVQG